MLVVTHDLPFAATLCERAVILSPAGSSPTARARTSCATTRCWPRTTSSFRPGSTPPAGCRRGLICTFRRMADVAMPRLSDSMEEGTILKWLKSDGDEVSRGDELVEIETDKANMTYEADQAGPLKIVAQEGDTLAVGATIARIGGGSNGQAPAASLRGRAGSEGGGGGRGTGGGGEDRRRRGAARGGRPTRGGRGEPAEGDATAAEGLPGGAPDGA